MPLLGPNGMPMSQNPEPSPSPEAEPPVPQKVTTAFTVFQTPGGQWMATDDFSMTFVPSRPPTPDDLIAGCENVRQQTIAIRTASITAQMTLSNIQNAARQAQAAMPTAQEQALAAKLMSGRL